MPRFRRELCRAAIRAFLLAFAFSLGDATAQTASPGPRISSSSIKSDADWTQIPIPIGQDARGLILPDFDLQGKMRARFEAGMALRLDKETIQLAGLKMTTFDLENKTELQIEMSLAILNLKEKTLTSQQRTSITRNDFHISGDNMQFDLAARTGRMTGNVKMSIRDQMLIPEPEQ